MRRSRSTNATRPHIHRTTAASRGKQIQTRQLSPEPRSGYTTQTGGRVAPGSPRSRGSPKNASAARRGVQEHSIGAPDTANNPIAKIVHHQRMQNEYDKHCDMEDYKQLIKETLDEGKDSFIIKLLQIDVKDFPQAIVVLQNELQEYQSNTPKTDARVADADIHHQFIQRGVDAMKRMTQGEDMGSPEWTINK